MKITEATAAHVIKLAALAVHADEMLYEEAKPAGVGMHAAQFDRDSIRGLLTDPQVRELLDDPENAVFLPVRRE